MKLTHVALITPHVRRMRFYRRAFEREPSVDGPGHAEFALGGAVVSLWDLAARLKRAPDTAEAKAKRSLIVELEVEDVDAEFARIRALGFEIAKPVATQEWGNRALYFRDPDGDLVNFYAKVAAH